MLKTFRTLIILFVPLFLIQACGESVNPDDRESPTNLSAQLNPTNVDTDTAPTDEEVEYTSTEENPMDGISGFTDGGFGMALPGAEKPGDGTETGNVTRFVLADGQNGLYGKLLKSDTEAFEILSANITLGKIGLISRHSSILETFELSVMDGMLICRDDDDFDILGILGQLSEAAPTVLIANLLSKGGQPSIGIDLVDYEGKVLRLESDISDKFGFYFKNTLAYTGNRLGLLFDLPNAIDSLDLSSIKLTENLTVLDDTNAPELLEKLRKSLIQNATLEYAEDVSGTMDLQEITQTIAWGTDMPEETIEEDPPVEYTE